MLVTKVTEIEHLTVAGTVFKGIQARLAGTNDYTFNTILHHISAKVKMSFKLLAISSDYGVFVSPLYLLW